MATYVHKENGEVTERVRTVPASHNDKVLTAKAADEQSGWSREDEPGPDAPESQAVGQAAAGEQARARRGRGTANVTTGGGNATDETPES